MTTMTTTVERPETTKTHTFTVTLAVSTVEELHRQKQNGTQIGAFVRQAIEEKLSREKRKSLELVR